MDESKQTGTDWTEFERKAAAQINSLFDGAKQSMVEQGKAMIDLRDLVGQERFDAQFSETAPEPMFRMPGALRSALMEAAPDGVEAITEEIVSQYLDYLLTAFANE